MILNGRTFKKEFSDLRCKIRQPFFGKTWYVNWFYGCFSLSHDPGDSSIQKRTGWLANRFYVTRLKCQSSARVKIVLKKDLIVKKVFKSWKMLKKIKKNFFLKKSEKIRKNRKKSKKIEKKIIRNNQKNNQ